MVDSPQQTATLGRFLIVDDDATFSRVLARSLGREGYQTCVASSAEAALQQAREQAFDFCTLDLKMEGSSGLSALPELLALQPALKIVVLTGFASISTAVEAIKLGAVQYLPKPASTEQIIAALNQQGGNPEAQINERPMSVNRLEWEHIHKVLSEHDGNISATARALGMHRRTLQRKLAKHPVRQ